MDTLIVIAIILTILFIILQMSNYSKFWKQFMEIPGPKGYPIIGNLLDIWYDTDTIFLHQRQRAKLYYPIFKLWSFNIGAVFIICPEDIELLLANTKHITKSHLYDFGHAWLGTGLLTSSGFKWYNRRKILTPAFHFSILQEFVSVFNKETENLVEVLERNCHKPYINVVDPITDYTLNSIVETSLGVSLKKIPSATYREAILKYGKNLAYRLIRPWLHCKSLYELTSLCKDDKNIIKILHDFSNTIIQERNKLFKSEKKVPYSLKKRLALLDLLLTAKYDGADIDDEGIREEVDTFMFEAHDTTSMGLCFTLMALANEQRIQEEILKEIYEILGDSDKTPTYKNFMELKYMERCIKECLRLYPSVPLIARITGEDIKTYSGYTIPKGANVIVHIFDLHRLPQYWENPEKFDPDRFLPDNIANRHPFAYLPFSAGPRNCIGQKFAILEIKAVLCGILRKFKLDPVDTPHNFKFKGDLILRPFDGIRVKFVPRK